MKYTHYKKLNILGIIIARKGSKGVPNKNLLRLNNKYLIEIAMIEAKKSKKLTKIIFSTKVSRNRLNKPYFILPSPNHEQIG